MTQKRLMMWHGFLAMRTRPHEKLIVWKESYKLCLWMYKLTKKFPNEERYSLVNQMRRSAYSVPTNIAEGNTKRSIADRKRFIEIAEASVEELHCQCRLSYDLTYISHSEFEHANEQIMRVSYLIHKLRDALS